MAPLFFNLSLVTSIGRGSINIDYVNELMNEEYSVRFISAPPFPRSAKFKLSPSLSQAAHLNLSINMATISTANKQTS